MGGNWDDGAVYATGRAVFCPNAEKVMNNTLAQNAGTALEVSIAFNPPDL